MGAVTYSDAGSTHTVRFVVAAEMLARVRLWSWGEDLCFLRAVRRTRSTSNLAMSVVKIHFMMCTFFATCGMQTSRLTLSEQATCELEEKESEEVEDEVEDIVLVDLED